MESSASPYRYLEKFKTKLISQICFYVIMYLKKKEHIQRGEKNFFSVRSTLTKIWHRRPC